MTDLPGAKARQCGEGKNVQLTPIMQRALLCARRTRELPSLTNVVSCSRSPPSLPVSPVQPGMAPERSSRTVHRDSWVRGC